MAAPIALSMIVRNEEAHLAGCLETVADLVCEIVIADTGSTDRTREIAARFGARVVEFPWREDFAAARNESLRHVRAPWVFWMDADDRLDGANRQRFAKLAAGLGEDNVGYQMKCVSPRDPGSGKATVTDHLRVFCNRPEIRWESRVHEQIRSSVLASGGALRWSDVVVHHRGYEDAAVRAAKAERNLRLLLMENAERPNNPFVLFNIGRSHHVLGRKHEAVPYWQRSLQLSPRDAQYLPRLYVLLVESLYDENRLYEALALCRQGLTLFPDDAELLFHESSLMIETGDLVNAEGRLHRWLALPSSGDAILQDLDLPCKVRHNLAYIHMRQNRPADAEAQLRAALAARPEYRVAWQGLGQLWLGQGRLEEAEEAARQLSAVPVTAVDGAQLAARVSLARGDLVAARAALEEGVRLAPANPRLYFLLGQAIAGQGGDWDAAEAAFRRVLELVPGNTEALQQLAAVQRSRQTAPPPEAAPPAPTPAVEVYPCPVCGGVEHEPSDALGLNSQASGEWLLCSQCGHSFAAVRDESLVAVGAEEAHEYTRLLAWSEAVRRVWQRCPGGDFLVLGPAGPLLSASAEEYGYRVLTGSADGGDATSAHVVFLGGAIETHPEPAALLHAARARMAPRGFLWLQVAHRDGAWRRICNGDAAPVGPERQHFFSLRSLRLLLQNQGLAVLDQRLSPLREGYVDLLLARTEG